MCEIPRGALMRHSTFRPLDNSRDQHGNLEHLHQSNIDVLHNVGVHAFHNWFWQYPFCNVHWLWQPDELHQPLLGLVKDLLHWLLKYLKARNVKDQFDNPFTLVPQYLRLQRVSRPFHWVNNSSWKWKEIRAMNRLLAVNCTPILDSTLDDRNTAVETASNEMAMGVVWALCEFALLVSWHNHLEQSLPALDNALMHCYKIKGAFQVEKMSNSAKPIVDELLEW